MSKRKEWTTIQCKNPPNKRCAHTTSFYKNKLYIFPGFEFQGISTSTTELPFFDFSTNEWSSIIQLKDAPKRQQAVSITYKDKFYIFGGSFDNQTGDVEYSSSIFEYEFQTNLWKLIQPNSKSPPKRFKHSGCLVQDSLIIYGGSNPMNNALYNDVWEFNLITKEWTNLKIENDQENPISGRMAHCSATDDENIFVFGGKCTNTDKRFNTLYELNLKMKKWKLLPNGGDYPSERAGSTLNYFKSNLYLFGGFNGDKDVNEFYQYNLNSKKWNEIILMNPPVGRSFHTCNLIFDQSWKLVIFGGLYEEYSGGGSRQLSLNQFLALLSNTEAYHNDLLIYNLENDSFFSNLFSNLKNENFVESIFIFQD